MEFRASKSNLEKPFFSHIFYKVYQLVYIEAIQCIADTRIFEGFQWIDSKAWKVLDCASSYLSEIVDWGSLFMGQMAVQISTLEHQSVHFKGG